MLLTYLMLAVALGLSAIAAFYSIVGLVAIFSAAAMPIIMMGSILEVAKLTVTVWLHEYWNRINLLTKTYLSASVVILMTITSMGIFGFLSKAHSDQSMIGGDVQAKIAIYDEKIKTAKENIDANRRALKQMDEAVDQIMGRSTTETGAERSVQIRRQQGPERKRLIAEIEAEQKKISALNEERAPIAAEVRKVEAEVGPIKYIAALIYGDDPDNNLLERAVRWVIILLVIVFDPLAVTMLVSATQSRSWELQARAAAKNSGPPPEPELTAEQQELMALGRNVQQEAQLAAEANEKISDIPPDNDLLEVDRFVEQAAEQTFKEIEQQENSEKPAPPPGLDFALAFGNKFPVDAVKGDSYIRTDELPTNLYKFNGRKWILVDKKASDSYAYNDGYISYLIEKIKTGEYDPELLSDAERIRIEELLRKDLQ